MSTAALASARRRRTTNDIASSQNVSVKATQQESPNSSKQVMPTPPPQSLTPLQILQLHDNKLKDLEALMVELNSEEYITSVVEEKINDLMQEKLLAFSSELDKIAPSTTKNSTNDLEAKLQILETSIQTNLTVQNARLDEFKENTIKMIELLTSKENHISTNNVTTSDVEKIDMLTKEVNELKVLVIKSQILAHETCNSIICIKDEFKLSNEKIMQNVDKISAMNTRQWNAPQCDPAQMFLQSFMKNKLFGGGNIMNMGEDYEEEDGADEDDEPELNTTKKLHIDLNNEEVILNDEEVILNDEEEENVNTQELIIDENQLQEILESNSMDEINLNNDLLKQEVIDEIRKIETNVTETNVTETNVTETNVTETNVTETTATHESN